MMQTRDGSLHLDAQETIILALYFSFLVLAGASTLIRGDITVTIVALKNEIALSLVVVCLLLGFRRESQIYRAMRYLYRVFYAQIPVMVYQALLVVPQRITVRGEDGKWDSVVGTFGDGPMRGGNTAATGLFCPLTMLLKVSEYKHGFATFKSMALHIVLGIGLCTISEVKLVTLLSPVFPAWAWFSLSYVRDVSKVNLKMLLAIVTGTLLLVSLPTVILAYYYSAALDGDLSKGSLSIFIDSLSRIFDLNYIMSTGELRRFTMFLFWLKNSNLWELSKMLFSHGLNTINSGNTVSPGFLSIIYNLILGLTSLSMLLWGVGMIGTLLFISLFVYILKACQPEPLPTLKQLDQQDLQLLSFAPTFSAFAISCLISLPYSQILMTTPML